MTFKRPERRATENLARLRRNLRLILERDRDPRTGLDGPKAREARQTLEGVSLLAQVLREDPEPRDDAPGSPRIAGGDQGELPDHLGHDRDTLAWSRALIGDPPPEGPGDWFGGLAGAVMMLRSAPPPDEAEALARRLEALDRRTRIAGRPCVLLEAAASLRGIALGVRIDQTIIEGRGLEIDRTSGEPRLRAQRPGRPRSLAGLFVCAAYEQVVRGKILDRNGRTESYGREACEAIRRRLTHWSGNMVLPEQLSDELIRSRLRRYLTKRARHEA